MTELSGAKNRPGRRERRPGAGPAAVTAGALATGEDEGPNNPALDVAMARVGDRWTLLIIDALMDGPRRFKDLEAAVAGLAPNVLSARLRRMEGDGLVMAVPYSQRPPRYEYRVSAEGRELAGAMRLLASWGARALGDEHEGPRHRACGTPLQARWYCPTCQRVTDQADDDVAWL
ncbi:MAG: helix-turn-helix domain-containing protein [Acidimicrobiales bacterium]